MPAAPMSVVVAEGTKAPKAKSLLDMKKAANDTSFLPGIAPTTPAPAPKPFNIEDAIKEKERQKGNEIQIKVERQ